MTTQNPYINKEVSMLYELGLDDAEVSYLIHRRIKHEIAEEKWS